MNDDSMKDSPSAQRPLENATGQGARYILIGFFIMLCNQTSKNTLCCT